MMKKSNFKKLLKKAAVFTVIAAIAAETVVEPIGQMSWGNKISGLETVLGGTTADNVASFIQKIEDLQGTSYQDYIDSSVMFQLPDTIKSEDEISVIITLDNITIMDAYEGTDKTMSFTDYALKSDDAAKIEADIAAEKEEILDKLDELGINYKLGEDYSTVLSGFEILIKAADFKTTCMSLDNNTGVIVGEEYNVCETELVENDVNMYETGIFDSSESGFDGSGMVVAVLDTGLESNHSAFSVDNFTSENLGLTYEDVAALVDKTTASKLLEGLTVDDVYINEKVPFGFDYADNDPDVYSTHNNHGTHVSGVIVGKDDTITGVAPNAQLVSMKIFSDVMDTARTAWILSALEDCVVLDVDVINMSIGTSCGFSRESDEETLNGVYDKIREAGISMIVAASNSFSSAYGSESNGNLGLTSNPDTGTVGSPSTYEGVMSVASISGVETPYILYDETIIYFIESTDAASEENDFVKTLLGDEDSAELEYVVIPGVGRSADYSGIDVEGKIVLVRRGSNTFEEKAIIAEEQGAAGIIIYNNVSGDIKMNVGDATLAVCSISQDAGEMLAEAGNGTIKVSTSQTSGPFISDFSSWGPTPDLGIKPEITAHGGNILSAVTGGGYDRISGTSMACPNLAGVVVLLRQYVVENFPDIADDHVAVNAMVYRLLMSTADIALNKNGSPYAVRKQGSGLANLLKAIDTNAYVTTYDKEGNAMDKTKIELGDDKDKNGVYELKFTINNFGDKDLTYDIGAYVMTEGVSDTKTNAGETTVTEESYILGASVAVTGVENGEQSDNEVTVLAGTDATVTVKITLTDADKKYLDESFENGMYVEGFVTLNAVAGTDIDLNVPYLAFYGDWTVAPLFDLDYYDTNADELDDAISVEDKVMADAYATRPIGGVSDDFVSYLGTYYFLQDDADIDIPASRDHISLSNQIGTIHSLRYVWAGLLRNAANMNVAITDSTTGELIFETDDDDVRKSYGDGAAPYPANIEIEFDTIDYNLKNNQELYVTITGTLDYGDGGVESNEKRTFEFPITIDFEAPTITNVEFRYEYDKTLKKNRLYADVMVYDNHYAMSAQLGYITMEADADGNMVQTMKAFEQYMTPIYSEKNSTTKVTYELTDYINDIKNNSINKNTFVVSVYDYAINTATYEIGLPDDVFDILLMDENDDEVKEIIISPNEVYTLEPLVYPSETWVELLECASSKPGVARVINNKIVGVSKGKAVVKIQDPITNKNITVNVTVLGEGDEGYKVYDKPVADVFRLYGFYTIKAYYMLASEDKDIGDTGTNNFFEGNYSLSMYPSESVGLQCTLDSYFPNDTTVEYESSNEEIVKVDASGVVTAQAEGFASVTIKVMQNGESTYYSETVSVEVKDPYVTSGPVLTHYYGNGGLVDIPSRLSLTEIGSFSFSNFEYVLKSEEELAFDDAETSKQWYIGDSTITKVIIPEGVEKINAYAFANLTALEEVVLPSTLQFIEYGAFYGCTSLKTISFSSENNVKIINQNAFENCALSGTLEFPQIYTISDYAFAGNKNIEEIILGEKLLSVGQYAFAACEKLATVTINTDSVKYGAYAFTGCDALTEFYVNGPVLPEGMFYECENMTKVTIGPNVGDIGPFAFRDTKIETIEISTGNTSFMVQTDDHVLSADGTELIAVSPLITGEFTVDNLNSTTVTTIGRGAFSHNLKITSITLPNVTLIDDYGVSSGKNLTSVTFGTLEKVGEYAFFETGITAIPTLAEGLVVGKYAFSHTDLVSVVIGDNMTIEEGTFSECMKLESVTIGNNVIIGDYAFSVNKDNAFKTLNYEENGNKFFYYDFATKLTSLTIGENAMIGENAFSYAASLESVALGANASIGKMAFYNCQRLASIDLSKAISIGDYAFSGDVYYICLDDSMIYAAPSADGMYMYTYHATKLTTADISSATTVGEHAFSYCRDMTSVTFNSELTEIAQYAFAGCIKLASANLDNIVNVNDYAFMETALTAVKLPVAEKVGEYAFLNCHALETLEFGMAGVDVLEGAFSYCEKLYKATGSENIENVYEYAFAYTAITDIDLSGAVLIDTHVFLKSELTPFKVMLGTGLTTLGDNPFAMCQLQPFSTTYVENFAGVDYDTKEYTYDISNTVSIIDGSLYYLTDNGYELVTYAGTNNADVQIAEDTIRITAMAFAGSEVEVVKLPYTVEAIGHKAFYGCEKLSVVAFGSYNVPILEEEYDPVYYECLQNIPGSGDYGTYQDGYGNEYTIGSLNIIPYFMWNATGGSYSNVFYGANFKDYVGCVEDKLVMIRPSNGQKYDSFILEQYFDVVVDGTLAPDAATLAAIEAINDIPEKVSYQDKALVEAARAAYDRIATIEQKGLVTNYSVLVSAEQRITALTPTEYPTTDTPAPKAKKNVKAIVITVVVLLLLAVAGALGYIYRDKLKTVADLIRDKYEELKSKLEAKKAKMQADKRAEIEAKRAAMTEEEREMARAKARKEAIEDEKIIEALKFIGSVAGGIVAIAFAGVLLVGGVKTIGSSCTKDLTPYEVNDEEKYNVSVKFDANGGSFTTNTSVITDSFNISNMSTNANGNVEISLIAPDNSLRGNDAFKAVKNGYFLAGWYQNRTEATDSEGNTVYSYSGKWDFDSSVVEVAKNGQYSADEPVITLYAAWVPLFEIELYDIATGEYVSEIAYDPAMMSEFEIPAWDLESGTMEMYEFPEREGYTFNAAYYDAEGLEPVETATITHSGSVNYDNGTAVDNVMKLYVDWTEGEWYHIYTAEQFVDNASVTGNYEIYADLDFSEEIWPSTFMTGNFEGTINGNNHTFKNIEFSQTNNSKVNTGLFGYILDNAKISNVTFEDVTFNIEAGTRMVGASFGLFAGTLSGEAVIENVNISEGKIIIDSDSYFGVDDYSIGLICGMGDDSVITATDITCKAGGENPKNVRITITGNTITLEFVTD